MIKTDSTKYNEAGKLNKGYIDNNNDLEKENFVSSKEIGTDFTYTHKLVPLYVFLCTSVHLLGLWGMAVISTGSVNLKTLLWQFFLTIYAIQGVTVGTHRFYTHKSFKATALLRALIVLGETLGGTLSVFHWCLMHRLHHRYSDTDGDPHNVNRGFLFSHLGWILTEGNPTIKKLVRQVDMSDLQADWMVMFQKKHYVLMFIVVSLLLPTWVPVYFFGESILNSFLVCFVRWTLMIHIEGSINSFAHIYGTKPYDKKIHPVESWFVSVVTLGEGWHNYHHAFPWDYKAAELFNLNLSARTIQLFEKLGLAWDLKTASPEQIRNRILRSGDGTHHLLGNDEARARVTAIGPLHPLNPMYRSHGQ